MTFCLCRLLNLLFILLIYFCILNASVLQLGFGRFAGFYLFIFNFFKIAVSVTEKNLADVHRPFE